MGRGESSEEYLERTGSTFVGHEPCPYCNSRDNLARYSDGHGYCFGCHYAEPAVKGWRTKLHVTKKDLKNQGVRLLPDDAAPPIGAAGWRWLKEYGLTDVEVDRFLWSDDKQWLIFPYRDGEGNIIAWQARNFNAERPKPKYYTAGNISDVMVFYGDGETVVLVEDVISAIKVGRSSGVVGVPLFGSTVSLKLLVRLATRFKRCGVWLDMDKARESILARSRASQYFPEVFSVLTPRDPKEYDSIQINNMLLSNMLTPEEDKDKYLEEMGILAKELEAPLTSECK